MEETSDVRLSALVKVAIALFVAAVVIHVGLWILFEVYEARTAARDPRPLPIELEGGAPREPPEPRLRPDPRADLAAMRAAEEKVLTTYGWVDREAGVVRIPIERAMEIVAEKGLPVRKEAPR